MFIDLLNNLALTSVFLFIGGKYLETKSVKEIASIKNRLLIGGLTGILGILLLANAIQVGNNVIVDLRYLAIILAATNGGVLSSIVSSAIIGLGRLTIYGISSTSIIGALLTVTIGFFCAYISRRKIPNMRKQVYMNVFSVALLSTFIHLLIDDLEVSRKVFVLYWPIAVMAGFFSYLASEFIRKSNENSRFISRFQEMAENSTDLISIHTFWGKYLYLSPSSKKLLEYEVEELIDKYPSSLIPAEDWPSVQNAFFEVVRTSKEYTVRYRMKQKSGSYIWLETAAKKMRETKENRNEIICVSRDISDRKQMEDELNEKNRILEYLSNYDSLTQIPNRRYFDRTLEKEWNKAVENSTPISLFLFDIDYFKNYNDTYGHQQGDECIKEIAQTGQSILPNSSDVICRYGGEEFVVLLPETSQYAAFKLADRLRKTIQALAIPHEKSKVIPVVTISAGVSTIIPKRDDHIQELLKKADQALYQAKANGRNRVANY